MGSCPRGSWAEQEAWAHGQAKAQEAAGQQHPEAGAHRGPPSLPVRERGSSLCSEVAQDKEMALQVSTDLFHLQPELQDLSVLVLALCV